MKTALVVGLMFLAVLPAGAATLLVGVQGTPTGTFQNMDLFISGSDLTVSAIAHGGLSNMVAPTGSGDPYWNNGTCNIGNYVTGTGCYAGDPKSPVWTVPSTQYLGQPGSIAPTDIMFAGSGTVSISIADETALTYTLYWFNPNSPNTLHVVLPSGSTIGTATSFSASAQFGLAISPDGGTTVYKSTVGPQPLAVFENTAAAVPEPATLGITSLGLLALGFARRYRKS